MSNDDFAIRVEGLGKRYVLGNFGEKERYTALRDVLARKGKGLMQKALAFGKGGDRKPKEDPDEFWALKDVSFEIKRGEVTGIIGRNGAGKSTLLKILSRITEPSAGQARIQGRVASLLEVGTGFHPELTGRENIFLNGAILGMSRAEIKQKFDEIVAFAEVERFLDTPVKRYSSGMYVRLAFAVAAHLEPEILVVDEVLAVGDAEFQKKCMGKMGNVSREGKTVLLVSHNLQAMTHLCKHGILLNQGRMVSQAPIADIARQYLNFNADYGGKMDLRKFRKGSHGVKVRLLECKFMNGQGQPSTSIDRTEELETELTVQVLEPLRRFDISTAVLTAQGIPVFSELLSDEGEAKPLGCGIYTVSFRLPVRYMKAELYHLSLWGLDGDSIEDYIEGVPMPEITDKYGDTLRGAKRWGVVRIPVTWSEVKEAKLA